MSNVSCVLAVFAAVLLSACVPAAPRQGITPEVRALGGSAPTGPATQAVVEGMPSRVPATATRQATAVASATPAPSHTPTLPASPTRAASATPATSATPVPTAVDHEGIEAYPIPASPLTATASYTDTVVGCVLDYPAGWFIEGQPGSVAVLTSYDTRVVAGRGGTISGTAKMDIVPQPLPTGETPEGLALEISGQVQSVRSQKQLLLPSGLSAIRLEYDSEQVQGMHALIAVINGYSVRIYSYGDQRYFDAIARSLRPVR